MGGATAQKKMMRMDPITRQVPERTMQEFSRMGPISDQEIAMLGEVASPVGMPSRIMANSLFRPLGGPDEEIAKFGEVVSPVGMPTFLAPLRQQIPMRTTPMSVR